MRIAENWKDYKIIDTSSGDKLESWGGKVLVRPDPQIIWKSPKRSDLWTKADGIYHRSSKGGGEWEYRKRLPESWNIGYKNLKFIIRPTGFKHTGLFPEQAVNWDFMADKIRNAGRGPGGEIWKLEDCIYDLVKTCSGVLSDEPLFFLLNSYTTGLSPSVMAYILRDVLGTRFGGNVTADEIGLPVEATGGVLPCGSTAIWQK